MTSLLMKPTSVGKDTRHKLDQPLKKLAYVSNHWGPLLTTFLVKPFFGRHVGTASTTSVIVNLLKCSKSVELTLLYRWI
ncbi:hypothetical protein BJL83_15685 [Vibrio parahaemolyticus]|nr:hypothetical protein BJL83_15685 [Vibrio parahaemolyticus]